MENIDFNYLCTLIGNLSGIPIRVYQNNNKIFFHSLVSLIKDPIIPYEEEILKINKNIGYFITPNFLYYGVINHHNYKIVIGPSIQMTFNEQDLKQLAFECDVCVDDVQEFSSGMKSIVSMPLESILQMLCTINYVLNKEKTSLNDIAIYENDQRLFKKSIERERINSIFEYNESKVVHNTMTLENTIMSYVHHGDTNALRKLINEAPAVRAGIVATDQLRQYKNIFIVTATLASRSAIRGGMDVDDALSLSDSYIKKCELLNNIDSIFNLQYHMLFDYTERVEKLRFGHKPNKFVQDIINYIHHHLSEPITTESIAKKMYLSRSRLSVKFKEETGETLNDFILKEKIEEAKRLLRYTDKPFIAISNYLGFSSQSHFSRTFKKYTNYTPNEYRKKHLIG